MACGLLMLAIMVRTSGPRSCFSPAIRLLNRLTLPQKFALISFFFAVPLVLVLSFLSTRIQQQISVAALEADGVDYLTPLNALHNELPQAMSLASAYLQKQGFAMEQLNAVLADNPYEATKVRWGKTAAAGEARRARAKADDANAEV